MNRRVLFTVFRGSLMELKVGEGPFIGSNVEIIRKLFGKTVTKNIHGSYKIKENKWAAFIYLAIQLPNGEWNPPLKAPPNYWINIPNGDNSEFTRLCYEEDLKKRFANPTVEYAVFTKKSLTECFFYGIFKLKEVKNNYIECVYKRIKTEFDCKEWKVVSI